MYDKSTFIHIMRLYRTDGVGPITFWQLMRVCKTAKKAIELLPELAKRGGKNRNFNIPSIHTAEKELETVTRFGGGTLFYTSPQYPKLLKHIPDSPPFIHTFGNIHLLKKPMVAMVGARQATINGMHFAEQIATQLGMCGYVIVSGMAEGIDANAHHGALKSGTIGVIGQGIDQIYPLKNKSLYHAIYKAGLLISEYAPGSLPQSRHFPQRNRIIAGISLGTIVIEASLHSGSKITARLANEYGREVFAVPGHPSNPTSAGSNGLIKEGAILLQTIDDVLDNLHSEALREPSLIFKENYKPNTDNTWKHNDIQLQEYIEKHLSTTPVSVSIIAKTLQIDESQLSLPLLQLELAGKIIRNAEGAYFRLLDTHK